MSKTYSLKTLGNEHTLPIPMGNANRYIKFKKVEATAPLAYFDTNDKKLMAAIEKSQFFDSGELKILFSDEDTLKATGKAVEKKEVEKKTDVTDVFTDVTTFGQAKTILTGDPYNIAKTSPSLASPEAIFKTAAELGISFPSLPPAEE